MAYFGTKIAFCITLALLSAATGEAKTNLRPYIARLQHRSAKSGKPVTPSAAVHAKPSRAEVTALLAVKSMPAPASQPVQPALTQLTEDLEEVKQLRTNVMTAEQALAADVSLLRESTMLERKAASATAREAAHKQVQDAEKVVKAAEAVVKESRESSIVIAREALNEANEVQHAADELTAVAMGELKSRPHPKNIQAAKSEEQTPKPQQPKAQVQVKVQSKPHKLRKAKAKAPSAGHVAATKSIKATTAATPVATKKKPIVKPKVAVPQVHIEKRAAAQVRHVAPTGPPLRKLSKKVTAPQGQTNVPPSFETELEKLVRANVPTASIQASQKKYASVVPPAPMKKKAPTQASKPRHVQKVVPRELKKVPAPPAHVQVTASLAHNVAPPVAQMTPSVTTDTDTDSDDVSESEDTQSDDVGPSASSSAPDDDLY